jgi:hypothetical protein
MSHSAKFQWYGRMDVPLGKLVMYHVTLCEELWELCINPLFYKKKMVGTSENTVIDWQKNFDLPFVKYANNRKLKTVVKAFVYLPLFKT